MSSTSVAKPLARRASRGRSPRRTWTTERIVFTTLNTTFLVALAALMIYPLLNTLAVSLNDGQDAVRGGIGIWPRVFSLRNYEVVLNMNTIYQAFFMSVLKTVVVVVTNLLFTSMLAYALSRKEFIFRRPITLIFVLTLYFDAGLIPPNYLLIKDLGMLNSFQAYWVPTIISAFNLIILRTYMKSIPPDEITESARIDGAGEFRTWWQIVMPLCKPTLAVVGLFVAVGSWNAWLDTLLYNSGDQALSTLQYELQKLLASSMNAGANSANVAGNAARWGGAAGSSPHRSRCGRRSPWWRPSPILFVYPFLQKHFVSGLTIGSVKAEGVGLPAHRGRPAPRPRRPQLHSSAHRKARTIFRFNPPASRLWRAMDSLGSVILISLFWLVSLGLVVTAGAGTVVAYEVCRRYVLGKDAGLWAVGALAWQQSWRQATVVGLLTVPVAAVGILTFSYLPTLGLPGVLVPLMVVGLFLLLLVFWCLPLVARFTNPPTWRQVRNGLTLGADDAQPDVPARDRRGPRGASPSGTSCPRCSWHPA